MISSTSMGKRCRILLLTLTVPLFPQSTVAPEILLLSRIKPHTRQVLAHIPAYACTETMERYHRNFQAHGFRREDKIKLEVAEIGGKELFAKLGDKEFQDRALHQIVPAGLTGTGMFFQIA